MQIIERTALVTLAPGRSQVRLLEQVADSRAIEPGQSVADLLVAARCAAQKAYMSEADFLTLIKSAGAVVKLGCDDAALPCTQTVPL